MSTRLTPRLVTAAEARMRTAMGHLSVRQALLHDRKAGVTDMDIAAWMTRGETLAVRGGHVDDPGLGEHDRLCLELVGLDKGRATRALILAGEAAERVLASRDPRLAGAQVALVKHVAETLGEPVGLPSAGGDRPRDDTDLSQADMDLLSEDELRELEGLLKARAQASAGIRSLADRARSRRSDGAVVH